ncbi:MAG: hypothetical protein IKX70_04435 [Treponema sp.]|nr:hypothetical protein [Treponema sp.]
MNKIFIILSVLFVGLLVGCASKPAQTIENNNLSQLNEIKVSEAEINDFWDQPYFTLGYGAKTDDNINRYDDYKFNFDIELQLKIMKEEYYRIINLPEISSSEWLRFTRINWKVPDKNRENTTWQGHSRADVFTAADPNKEYRWDVWEADFLKDKNLENKNFTGKIINNSDETLEFCFLVRSPNHYYYLTVLPHSEKYYNIPATENNIDFQVSVSPLNSKAKGKGLVNFGKEYMDAELSKYIYNTYSLELTYNGSDDIKSYLWESNYYTDNWKLVKRYDVDEPAPEERFPAKLNSGK